MTPTIDSFEGEYRWLSNFWMAPFEADGYTWPSNEHYYQWRKCFTQIEGHPAEVTSPAEYASYLANMPAGAAKRAARKLPLDVRVWDMVKDTAMWWGLRAKFQQNRDLGDKLIETGDAILIEGNTWGDTYWGVCNGVGKNRLGILLMRLRTDLIAERAQERRRLCNAADQALLGILRASASSGYDLGIEGALETWFRAYS